MTNEGNGIEIAGKVSAVKSKIVVDDDKTGGGRKRRNLGVLEDSTADDGDFSDDFLHEELEILSAMNNEPCKGHRIFPFIPKEEELDEEESDTMMEEPYGEASIFIRFIGDEFDDKTMEPM